MKKILVSSLTLLLCLAMAVTAFAANFTPSVESKPAPELVMLTDSNGNQVSAIVTDAEGNEVALPEGVELVITPTSEKNTTPVDEISAMLLQAEEQIAKAANLGELTKEMLTALEEKKAANPAFAGVALEDLVVRDLFDVSFVRDGKTLEQLLQAGYSVTFAVETDLTEEDLYFILHNHTEKEWEVVKDVQIEDGIMTVTMGSLSPVAIVVNGGESLAVDPDAPSSPETGSSFPTGYLAGAIILAGAAVVLFVKARKQKAA